MRKTNAYVLAGLLVIISQSKSFAQAPTNARRSNFLVCAIKTVGSDVAYVVTSPSRLTTKGGLELLAFSAVTTGLILRADDKIDEELALEGYEFSSQPLKELAKLGQIYDDIKPANFALGLTATTLAGGLVLRDKKLLQTSRLLAESVVLTQLFTAWSKGVFGRARPYTDHGPHDFNLFRFDQSEDFKSMPSGHVSSVFALMTVIAKQYDHWYVEIPAYTFAVSVALQRMTSRNHWASDTMVGGALGYWVSSTLVRKQHEAPVNCAVQPYFIGNRLGVVMNF
ncbi:MAG: hypothetical protein ALAOOOJD_01469 [bacterium]|nr:hypothetical protein [bacterium]